MSHSERKIAVTKPLRHPRPSLRRSLSRGAATEPVDPRRRGSAAGRGSCGRATWGDFAAARRNSRKNCGLSLVELVLVLSIVGVLGVLSVRIVLSGTRTFMLVPRQELATQTGMEALQAALEGSPSSVSGVGVLRGLRFALPQTIAPVQPAVWLAETNRVGFLLPNNPTTTSDNQYVLIRLDSEQLKRSVYTATLPSPCPAFAIGTEEVLPYYSAGRARIMIGAQPIFRYYNQAGTELTPPGCSGTSVIRRVDVTFTAQTGGGSFDQSDASVPVQSSIAIRFP